jgi:primosomal protein N' (replication factor Y)
VRSPAKPSLTFVQASLDLEPEPCPEPGRADKPGAVDADPFDAIATVPVLLPLPLDSAFDYIVPDNVKKDGGALKPGDVVEVPFGPRTVSGVVWDEEPKKRASIKKLKAVQRSLDTPPIPRALLALIKHVADTTLHPLGNALRLAMAVPAAFDPPAPKMGLTKTSEGLEGVRLTAARKRVLEALDDGKPRLPADLARAAGVSSGVVHAMAKGGMLQTKPIPEEEDEAQTIRRDVVELSDAQKRAAEQLCSLVGEGDSVTLLEGVPGSGKTEVYLEAIVKALDRGEQVLVLLPEIALTSELLGRFRRRFSREVATWHSELGSARRRRLWRRIAEGREPIVIGARSALFLPFPKLGLIVVDEEHDSSFKQEDGVPYQGRDMAMARARFESCPIVLASATPALDTAYAAGRVIGAPAAGNPPIHLPSRFGQASMPSVDLIDLRKDRPPRGRWLSPSLSAALEETLAAGEQSLLFLNRRGYAPLTLCRACGQRLACPNCSAWLVHHRLKRRLLCHHCGYSRPEPEHCPSCGTLDALTVCGPGVERLMEEVRQVLPDARMAVMTSDSPGGAHAAAERLQAMRDHELDLLIGTQIIAKGHHFPDLTLVGVVDGDLGLSGGDLRAAERQFQLLYQVAGRAGRAERPGRVMIQTHLPDHPVMQGLKSGDKDRFYAEELAERQDAGLPPFGRLASLILSGRDASEVRALATEVARAAPDIPGLRVLGPAPAPIAMLRGRYRQRLLIVARDGVDLTSSIRDWIRGIKTKGNLRVQIDVDPYSFL